MFVPRSPGTLCALGAISADIVNDAVRTVHVRLEATPPTAFDAGALREHYDALRAELADWLARHGAGAGAATFRPAADMRYVGPVLRDRGAGRAGLAGGRAAAARS